ncbi:MAG: MFS transporter [Bacteroidota bacterium]
MKGRYFVAAGMFLLALLLYVDRVCISVAKESIAGDLALSDKEMGWVLSIFALGYALFQVPSGILADKFGPRRVLTSIVTIWSALTALTGAVWNFTSLLFVRFAFGAGEAGAFPGMARATYSWIPLRERGMVTGLNFSGSRLGAAFALPFVAWLITDFGWRNAFLVLGAIGVLWAIAWWLAFRDRPEDHPSLGEKEKEEILATRQQEAPEDAEPIDRARMAASTNMWSVVLQYFCSNFTFFFALTWLFPYLKETYQLGALEAGWYTSAPFIAGAIGNWVSGGMIDALYRKGNWDLSRQLPAMIGFSLAAIGLIASLFASSALVAVICLSVAIFGADMTLPPSWSLCVDIGRRSAGAVSGTMNMAGNLGAFLTALAFPYLTDWTGSEQVFFYVAAALNILAVGLWWRVQASRGMAY